MEDHKNARFAEADFTGARFHGVNFSGVKISDATELDRRVPSPNGGMTSVMSRLHIVLREEWWHDQYANRDLAILERGATPESTAEVLH